MIHVFFTHRLSPVTLAIHHSSLILLLIPLPSTPRITITHQPSPHPHHPPSHPTQKYKGSRANVGFRYNLFDHIGAVSTLRPETSTAYPGCYDELLVPTVFEVRLVDCVWCDDCGLWVVYYVFCGLGACVCMWLWLLRRTCGAHCIRCEDCARILCVRCSVMTADCVELVWDLLTFYLIRLTNFLSLLLFIAFFCTCTLCDVLRCILSV